MKRILIDTRCVLLISASLLALNANAGNEWFEFYNNTRSLGMGGASIAVTSDDTSLYRNPASLGSVRDIYGTMIDPEVEGTGNLTATQTDVGPLLTTLPAKPNTYYRAKQQVSPVLVRRNVGFGLIYKNEISAEVASADLTVMDTAYVSDIAAVLGANWRIADGRIKIGLNSRFHNRIEVKNTTLAVAGPSDLATIGSEGSAISFDGGVLFQAPWTYLPTLGAVVRDIGSTVFDKQDGFRLRTATRPATVPQSVDVALAMFPIHSNSLRSVWTLEYTDVTNSRNDTDSAKRAHLGIEFNTRDVFFFRLGYNQRYATGGFEVASENVVWQVSTYGEEIGTALAPREDRRLSMKFAVRF